MTGVGEFIISFAGENHYHLISSTPVFHCSTSFAYKLDVFVRLRIMSANMCMGGGICV